MGRTSISALSRYLLDGKLPRTTGCLGSGSLFRRAQPVRSLRYLQTTTSSAITSATTTTTTTTTTNTTQGSKAIPFRKQLKEEARLAKKKDTGSGKKKSKSDSQTVDGWELTVGIEIHAQLNTSRKLFSPARTSFNDDPNSHVALFDAAIPGSQPLFQRESLIPAVRAALALGCEIQPVSRFDRKHYFWWDQPSGYQITQYYEPLARGGSITLSPRDGIAPEDGEGVTVRITQVQLEQDTAKTLAQVGGVSWLDLNRVGTPLIEIITGPDIHHPRTAAALVRKIQLLLNTVDACVAGMETGGLRADVNVSVRRTGGTGPGILGTRTEIKNLNTIKAVEDAIIAERDRQIRVLEEGGVVAGETRGWSVGATETRRLRGKEGEVDYRYMPDPDIAPLVVGDDLVEQLRSTLAVLPDQELDSLINDYGLTPKDASSLMTLDNGARIQYFYNVVSLLQQDVSDAAESKTETGGKTANDADRPPLDGFAPLAANWIIHELGRLTTYKAGPAASGDLTFTLSGECEQVPAGELAVLLHYLHRRRITGKVAKELLVSIYLGDVPDGVHQTIEANDLWFDEISAEEYAKLADLAMQGEDKVLREFGPHSKKYPQGKLMFLVGKMMRLGPTERIEPSAAETIMRARIEQLHASQ